MVFKLDLLAMVSVVFQMIVEDLVGKSELDAVWY